MRLRLLDLGARVLIAGIAALILLRESLRDLRSVPTTKEPVS